MKHHQIALLLCLALASGALSGCETASGPVSEPDASGAGTALSAANDAAPRTPAALDLTGATAVTLSGAAVQIDGGGASAEGGVITITAGGTFVLSGTLTEGRVVVNAPGEDVVLALNGASVTCSCGSPLYIYQSGLTTLHIMAGTENTLADGGTYTFADALSSAADEEPNACLYSKSDLLIQGAGTLRVEANYNNGITGKDILEIYDVSLAVTAVNHGVTGRDSSTIDSASVTVVCGGDAIRSTNGDSGWVSVSNSVLDLDAGEDGVQAETRAVFSSGRYKIVSGGGSSVIPGDDSSSKGIKAGTALTLASGCYTLDCSDDALHSNGDLTVAGGVLTISTGDDALHAGGTLAVSGGALDILTSYEGLEGSDVAISGGAVTVVSSDDGVNAAGGNDGSGFRGRGPGNAFSVPGTDHAITISGGNLVVTAGGDGLDSNGDLYMSGGTVLASSTGNADGALDFDGVFSLTGGTLLAVTGGEMPQVPGSGGQHTLSISFDTALEAGTCVQLAGQNAAFVFRMSAPARNLVFSSPDLEDGETYTVSYGGNYTGGSEGGLCTGGTYSGGTILTELTLTDTVTAYGQTGGPGRAGGAGAPPAFSNGAVPGASGPGDRGNGPVGAPGPSRGGDA